MAQKSFEQYMAERNADQPSIQGLMATFTGNTKLQNEIAQKKYRKEYDEYAKNEAQTTEQNNAIAADKIKLENTIAEQNKALEIQRAKERQEAEVAGQRFVDAAQETPEMKAYREQLQAGSEGKDLMANALGQRMQEQAKKQAMAMAYARGGFNPAAIRGSQMALAEAQGGIAGQTAAAAQQEQAQKQAMYGQMLQYQSAQKQAAEQARAAYLQGDKQLANQFQQAQMQNQAALLGLQNQIQLQQMQGQTTLEASRISGQNQLAAANIAARANKDTADRDFWGKLTSAGLSGGAAILAGYASRSPAK